MWVSFELPLSNDFSNEKFMNDIKIRVVSNNQDVRTFIRFLWRIYDGNPAWVPPLLVDRRKLMDKKKNPFYKHADVEFYLAERDGTVVGRIAAIINHNHDKEHNEKMGFWGFFECIDDQDVANALFDAAKKYVKEHGAQYFRGPVNPSVNDEIGLLIEGFDVSPTLMMTYNPPYYIKLVEQYGFTKIKDLYAYLLDQNEVYTERFIRAHKLVQERQHIVLRNIDMKHFDEELQRVKYIYNSAWSKNWGAIPFTDEEIDALAADLKSILEPELILFAEKEGKAIGFALSLPDINMALKFNKKGYFLPGIYHLLTKKKLINLVRIIVSGCRSGTSQYGCGSRIVL